MARPSTKEIAGGNASKLKSWIAARDRKNDFSDYLHNRSLNRVQIANELAIPRSSLYTNQELKSLLDALEDRLRFMGILPSLSTVVFEQRSADERDQRQLRELETRLKSVEERNACLLAENRELRRKFERYQFIEDHLFETGRLLPK